MSRPAQLYACVYAREFPAQAMLRVRPALRQTAVAVLQGQPPRQSVCSLNRAAHQLGVAAGMTRAELDVFPAATLLPRSPAEEDSTRAALLQCVGQFSPRVEDRSDDTSFCSIADIAGTEKLFGPPEVLMKKLRQAMRALGIDAAVVISSNIHAATCLARGGKIRTAVIPSGQEAPMLASLPVSVLHPDPEYAETLSRWGITTLGQLAALPPKELIARLGQEGRRLRQLARGEAPHLLVPAAPAFSLEERIELDSPVELLDSLLFVLGVLLDHLIARAKEHILALASVEIELALEGGARHTRTVRPALPGTDRRIWLRLLHLDLQGNPPQARIVSVKLSAEPGSASKVQMGLFSPELPEPDRLDVTLAHIRSLAGEHNAGRAVLEDTRRPDAFRIEPFAIPATAPRPEPERRTSAVVRRLRPPEAVTLSFRRNHPATLVFRGTRYQVERACGPWISSGDWWAGGWSVEKWDLAARAGDNFLCCCLARHPGQEDWQIEALYD